MRHLIPAAAAAASLFFAAPALALPLDSDPAPAAAPPAPQVLTLPPSVVPPPSQVLTLPPSSVGPTNVLGGDSGSGGGGVAYPSGCRDLDISTAQSSVIFHTTIYRFHQLKHWCWRGGVVYGERHAWSFEGSATACLNTVYPPNAWSFVYWHNLGTSGSFSEERAHVTNCIFHIGDWKEFYPDVKIWAFANGDYRVETHN